MRRFVIFALVMIISAYATNVSAYEWTTVYEFPATRLVMVPKGRSNFDHIIFSFTDAQGRSSLLFVCHGTESEGKYYAYMGDEWHSDYAWAVDNEIRYHIKRGEVRNNFERVYFLTCHAGYAPQKTVTMPVLKKDLQMAVYDKGVQGLRQYYDSQGRIYAVALMHSHGMVLGNDSILDSFDPTDEYGVIIAGDVKE